MRKAIDNQLYIPFDHSFGRSKKLKKYEKIESFLRRNKEIYEIAHKDLTRHVKDPKSGAKGLTAATGRAGNRFKVMSGAASSVTT